MEMDVREWWSAKAIAALGHMVEGLSKKEWKIRIRASREGWIFREVKSSGCRSHTKEYHFKSLPASLRRAIILKFNNADLSPFQNKTSLDTPPTAPTDQAAKSEYLWAFYARASDAQKQKAKDRLAAIQAFENLLLAGVDKKSALHQVADLHGVSAGTIDSWLRCCAGVDRADRLPALMPQYVGRTTTCEVSPEAWDFFRSDYLRPERPAGSACYERLRRAAAEKNWVIPSRKTIMRKLNRELSPHVVVLARKGESALDCQLPTQKRDHSVFAAIEAINADGHRFDIFARFDDGTIARPVGIFWSDIFSGKMLSWRVGQTESAQLVLLSLGDLVEKFGIPRGAYLDNGRAFASKWLTGQIPNRYRFKVKPEDPAGVMAQLGIQVHWCRPYSGRSKPIERAFRDLCEYVAKHPSFSGAYCGNRPDAKPEDYGRRAVPIEEFSRVLSDEITAHNSREGRRSAVCRGMSFDAVFNESYSKSTIRKASDSQRHLWLLAAEGVTVSSQDASVTLAGNRYHAPALARFMGRKVVVRFDPARLHEPVFVFTMAGAIIAKADCIHAVGFDDMTAAKEHARQRRRAIKHAKKQLAAERRMRAIDVARMIPSPPEPESPAAKTIQPLFKRPAENNDSERRDSAFVAGVSKMRAALK